MKRTVLSDYLYYIVPQKNSNQLHQSYSVAALLLITCFEFFFYIFKVPVSAVSLDVFQSIHFIVYSYCFFYRVLNIC